MTKIILHNSIFNADRVYNTRKELKAEIGLNYETIKNLIDTGRELHGYTLDILEEEAPDEEELYI